MKQCLPIDLLRPARCWLRGLAATLVPLLIAVSLPAAQLALAQSDHRDGFTRYARIDRSDGTYREMLIEDAALGAVQAGLPLPDGATILMESYYRPGEIGSIFMKEREGGRWLYGSFQPEDAFPTASPRPQCAGCHRAALSSNGTFTLPMLKRFAETGVSQRAHCDRSGRAPCGASTYEGYNQQEKRDSR